GTQQFHSVTGTLPFMSPEQFTGKQLTTRSDLYSFGLTLYQLFSGVLPYRGEMILSIRQLNFGERLPSLIELNPSLPSGLDEILLRVTNLEPNARPESATEVVDAIYDLFPGAESDGQLGQGIAKLLESPDYHQREAEILLEGALSAWKDNRFSL